MTMKSLPLPSLKPILKPRKSGQQTRSRHSPSSLALRSGLKPAALRYCVLQLESGMEGIVVMETKNTLQILGKDNNPLYIRAFGAHDQLRFHFIVHTALDFVEEKGAAREGKTP